MPFMQPFAIYTGIDQYLEVRLSVLDLEVWVTAHADLPV